MCIALAGSKKLKHAAHLGEIIKLAVTEVWKIEALIFYFHYCCIKKIKE